ncbi:hypothetical protein M3Y97_00145100 [Aphelenchoides bicaudatus]|nr:hypothetical protein M3Y97_00145100 [Aphelenchoides bicaudatus]
MHLGEQRNKIYVFIAIVIFIFWYSTLKRRNHDELELEVQLLQKYSSSADYHSCSTDSCLKLDRCLFDLDRIRVYVQPMVKIKYPNGKELNVQESHEFQQIRQAISNILSYLLTQTFYCLTLLDFGILFHLKAIWASSSLDQYRLRRKFDVSIPMLRPYNLKLSNDSILDDTALKTSSQQWTAVLRYTSDSVTTQMKEALKSASSNSTLLYLFETKETEKDVTVVKDQEGQQRNYVDVLKHTTFTLIHDLVPGFQMIILDAMECGSIPVIISDEYLPPFHELLDWSRFSILLAKQNLQELPRILNSIQPELIVAMRQSVHSVYWRYLSSPHQVALSTLSLIERRILPVELDGKWPESEISTNKRLWFNVPIRSMASNFTIILAPPQQLDEFEHTIYQLSTSTRQFLHSILVLWPVAERPSNLHSLNLRLQNELSIAIHYLNWNPNDLSSKMSAFVDSIIYRSDASRDCWLFMDLRSQTAELKFTKDLMEQAFGAWKENADSILSFDPFNKQAEIQKQAPFYSGAAFIHPHAAEDIGKSSSKSEQWSRCSKLSSLSIDCKTEAKCPEFVMEFCRPTFL